MRAGSVAWILGTIPALMSVALVAAADEPPTPVARTRPAVYTSAPCTGVADLRVRLHDDPADNRFDRLRVRLTGAAPDRRWQLQIRRTDGDSESVGVAALTTSSHGGWSLRDELPLGRNILEFRAERRDRQGQRCAVDLTAQVSPRS